MNYYQIHPCTINFRHKNQGHSGVLFKNDHILTTASNLLLNISPRDRADIVRQLAANQLITNFKTIPNLPLFLVTYRENETLVQKEARLKLAFNCRSSRESLNSVLRGFKHESNLDADEIGLVFSSFLVLGLSNRDETKTEILTNILMQVGATVKFSKMDPVHTLCSLFGSDTFFGTYNSGIISNVIGNSLLVLSVPLVQGCEGGGVFNAKQKLLGLVIASCFYWKKDNITLTMAVQVDEIINELIQLDQSSHMKFVARKVAPSKMQKGESCVALIDSRASWGCGTFIKFRGKKFLITCAHILEGSPIEVFWKYGKYSPQIIYKNPKFNQAYDVALLTPPPDAPEECFTVLGKYKPAAGMRIYNIGFPLLSSMAKQEFSPFIYDGTVTSYSHGFLCSDSLVQAGQSGGPLFDPEWRLLGICVSNTRDDTDQRIFPFINMAVPIRDIYRVVEQYLETEDKSILEQLVASQDIQRKWNLEIPIFKTKL